MSWTEVDRMRAEHERKLADTKSAVARIVALGGRWTFRGVDNLGRWRASHRLHNPIEAKSGEELVAKIEEYEKSRQPKGAR